ncbi:unnamed protein product, partial [Coccothraustes coccothraustes]
VQSSPTHSSPRYPSKVKVDFLSGRHSKDVFHRATECRFNVALQHDISPPSGSAAALSVDNLRWSWVVVAVSASTAEQGAAEGTAAQQPVLSGVLAATAGHRGAAG